MGNICKCCKRDYAERIRNVIDEDEYSSNEELCILHSKN